MIDPKELRVGNLVLLGTSTNTVLGVDAASSFNIHIGDDYYGEDEIAPIPITPEWLERLGFDHKPQTYCDIWEVTITDYPDKNDNVALMVVFSTGQICVSLPEIERHDIKNIHQLQNLYFALTGTELTIRPETAQDLGCDIHLFVEVKKDGKWINADKWTKNPYFDQYPEDEREFKISRENSFYSGGRNYNLFTALCGVRGRNFIGEPPRISEPKGVPQDVSDRVREEISRWASDGHSHNWNTMDELKAFDWSAYGETTKAFTDEVLPKMESLKAENEDVRIVYFFDN